jgi:hypothetical protein
MTDGEFRDLDRRLQRLEQKVDVIVEAVTRQVTICAPTRARLDTMCKTVYGNGRDGLTSRVARLETVRRFWGSLAAGVLGLLSGTLLTVLAWVLNR